MRLLVTRPEPDAAALRAHLVAQGHTVLIEPLLSIRFLDTDPIELEGVQALIATSRNGLRALAGSPAFGRAKTLPVFAVGPGTAATAGALGFSMVIKGPANARELVPLIARHAEVNGGPLLHLAGDVVTATFADELLRLGYSVLQPTVYATETAARLSAATVMSLRNGRIDGVLLLSPRTASVYAGLIVQHALVKAARRIVHICLSPTVAARLKPIEPARVAVAAEPNIQGMLAVIAQAAAQSA